jgi:hypothetical protein
LDFLPINDWPVFPIEVNNISGKGARLHLPYREYAGELQPGRFGFPATLAVATAQVSLNLRVVYRERENVGVVFDGPGSGRRALESFIHDMGSQVVEDGGSRRCW